jgi:hypothetical protein
MLQVFISHGVSKPLLLIVAHNLIIGLISNGLAMAFGACIFMASLKKHIDNFKRPAFKGFATYNSESFTHFGGLWCFPPHLKTLGSVHVGS